MGGARGVRRSFDPVVLTSVFIVDLSLYFDEFPQLKLTVLLLLPLFACCDLVGIVSGGPGAFGGSAYPLVVHWGGGHFHWAFR